MSREAPGDLARDASVVQVLDSASPQVVDQQPFETKVLFWSRLSRQFGPVVPRQSREIQKATHRIVCLKFFNRGLLPVRCFIAPITEQFKAGSEIDVRAASPANQKSTSSHFDARRVGGISSTPTQCHRSLRLQSPKAPPLLRPRTSRGKRDSSPRYNSPPPRQRAVESRRPKPKRASQHSNVPVRRGWDVAPGGVPQPVATSISK
jgi:hypothetical protein